MSDKPLSTIRVLLVEDDEDDMVLTRALLQEIDPQRYELEWVAAPTPGLEAIVTGSYDVCLADYRMGEHNGVEFVRSALARDCRTPIIVLTGQANRTVDLAAMDAGAADFLSKADISPSTLERSIRYAIQHQKVQEQRLNLMREQAARAEAEAANQAKDEFLAALSHELRTPLTPVLVSIDALLQDRGLSDLVRGDLETIRRNVQLEARLIDDLLDLTRVARGKIEMHAQKVDLHELIRHASEMVEPEIAAAGLELTLDLAAKCRYVDADPARLQQVFWNLLKNAVKFTERGGVTVATRNENGRIIVDVRDTGIGIAPDTLPRIFDAFEQGGRAITRQYGGLGLGLAISKRLVELHGGTLTAASKGVGRGSSFSVALQTVTPAPATAASTAPAARAVSGLRILLVEDHPSTADVMRRLLVGLGYDVSIAANVAEALHCADEQTFDLLISDVGLPDGSGLDLMRALRPRGIRGICLSGYGMESDLQRSRDAGFAVHLVKPVDLQRLSDAIVEVAGCAAPTS